MATLDGHILIGEAPGTAAVPRRSRPALRRSALVVVNLQRGAFDGVRCPVIDHPQALVTRVLALLSAARASGTPVVFVQHCEGAGEVFEEGSLQAELHESLLPLPNETVVKKQASSAFVGTSLERLLRRLNVSDLVLCGLQSEFCVTSTARSALQRGFGVIVASDAHATWPTPGDSAPAIIERANAALQALGARLQPSATIAAWLVQD